MTGPVDDFMDMVRGVIGSKGVIGKRPPPREVWLHMPVKIHEEGVEQLRAAWERFKAEATRIAEEAAK